MLVLAILAVVIALQNTVVIIINFLFWKFAGSLALILILALIFGFIAGLLVIIPTVIKKSSIISNQKKKIADLREKGERTN